MSDTRELLQDESKPGWHVDPEKFYSAGWLDDGTVGMPVPHLRLVKTEEETDE